MRRAERVELAKPAAGDRVRDERAGHDRDVTAAGDGIEQEPRVVGLGRDPRLELVLGDVRLDVPAQLRADAVLVNKLKSLPNVTIHTNAQTTEITGDGQKVNGLRYKDRATGGEHHIALAGVFVQIGLIPNTEWLRGTVELSRHGEILIDAKCATNVPGIYAAGDVTTVPYKQIIIATGEGAKAALSAFDHLIRTPAQP